MKIPFLSRKEIDRHHAAYFVLQGYECFERRDYEAGKQWALKSLDLYADDISSRYCLAIMLNYLKEHADARNEWFKLLQQPDLAEELRPTVLNNIAWVNLFMGDADLLLEADLYSLEALQSMPDSPPFKGTRGSVLIELGNVEEGLPFVRAALAGNETPQFKALNLCYIALGESKLGNATEAIQARSEAHKLDPDCILLEKVDQRLAATRPPSAT